MTPRHLGGGPGFVEEDQSRRVEIELGLEPAAPPAQDVWPALLVRMRRLFLSVILRRPKNRQTAALLTMTPCSARAACMSNGLQN